MAFIECLLEGAESVWATKDDLRWTLVWMIFFFLTGVAAWFGWVGFGFNTGTGLGLLAVVLGSWSSCCVLWKLLFLFRESKREREWQQHLELKQKEQQRRDAQEEADRQAAISMFPELFGFPIEKSGTAVYTHCVYRIDGIIKEKASSFFEAVAREKQAREAIVGKPQDRALYEALDEACQVTVEAKRLFWHHFDTAERAGIPVRWLVKPHKKVVLGRHSHLMYEPERVDSLVDRRSFGFSSAEQSIECYKLHLTQIEEFC